MMVSTKGRYALRVMIDLAEHGEKGEYVSLSDISERQETDIMLAASYTSIGISRPSAAASKKSLSISVSMPPCPAAISFSVIFFHISGRYFSSYFAAVL